MTKATRYLHTFHIPVMGTGFSIDTALRVAKYGISSVISIGDDILIEKMRKFHCQKAGEPYEEIARSDEDARARRITAYLNLIDCLVQQQVKTLQVSPFEKGSEITCYHEMLPDSNTKQMYQDMLEENNPDKKFRMQQCLRTLAIPGSIDVNIMVKADHVNYCRGNKLPAKFNDAMAALRGYANSTLRSSIVFSAGINQYVYNYAAEFGDFFPDENGILKKKIILKVSDYRSAQIQAKFLAKKGLWVSEFRIESGLNCGGHAFASKGNLMGPILEEFKNSRVELIAMLHNIYSKALTTSGRTLNKIPHKVCITAQGGIGTADENELLLKYFDLDGTGWGTPFLLVPEVTNVDDIHLTKLSVASDNDVYLSDSSPLGVPFWNLRSSASEEARRQRIKKGKPGSSCPKGYLAFNTEFTKTPTCRASHAYQKLKLKQLINENNSKERLDLERNIVLSKLCLCNDLAGGVAIKTGIDKTASPAICCGPNIVNFSKIVSLEEMINHIYGKISLLTRSDRPHMFIREFACYVEYFHREIEMASLSLSTLKLKYFRQFKENLLNGANYYQHFAKKLQKRERNRFLNDLEVLYEAVKSAMLTEAQLICLQEPLLLGK